MFSPDKPLVPSKKKEETNQNASSLSNTKASAKTPAVAPVVDNAFGDDEDEDEGFDVRPDIKQNTTKIPEENKEKCPEIPG